MDIKIKAKNLALTTYTVRLSKQSLEKAKKLGVNIPELFREALEYGIIHAKEFERKKAPKE